MGIFISGQPTPTYYVQATEPPIVEGFVWYDTINKVRKLCDGTSYNSIGGITTDSELDSESNNTTNTKVEHNKHLQYDNDKSSLSNYN